MAEFTKERAIVIQKEQLQERSHIVREDVLQKLTTILEEHNKKVVNPHNIIRGSNIDNMLANYGLFKAGKGGFDLHENYELTKF